MFNAAPERLLKARPDITPVLDYASSPADRTAHLDPAQLKVGRQTRSLLGRPASAVAQGFPRKDDRRLTSTRRALVESLYSWEHGNINIGFLRQPGREGPVRAGGAWGRMVKPTLRSKID